MTIEELRRKLYTLVAKEDGGQFDTETAHVEADELLLEYINDEEVSRSFHDLNKWYA